MGVGEGIRLFRRGLKRGEVEVGWRWKVGGGTGVVIRRRKERKVMGMRGLGSGRGLGEDGVRSRIWVREGRRTRYATELLLLL